ncbi:MAG: hypothetical protein HON14_15605 [Rhodospirillaceae bacterium]|jgi:hypothetical protein|nr:hypothetical protein [Rhodospirillaceae bacterium]MBT4589996.1 hypothetical protein [Rhodospirillaceae bacterium]MBT4940561.1 hypothetical protein [Rhodospirillaceae bacterium]MBT7268966.1 hypothetical protein [Rhodospirillaceae bacterium]
MRTDLERDDFIVLLEQLKSDEDADILAAVRDINAKMTVAGVTWDDLLMSQDDAANDYQVDDEPDDEDSPDDEEDGDEEDDDELNPLSDEEKQEATGLISAIGEMEISEATKQELEEYKDDLEQGEFEQMDLRYLRALKSRLSA